MSKFSKPYAGLPRSKGRTTGKEPKRTPRNMQKHPTFQSERTMGVGVRSKINKDITRMKLRGN